MNLPVEGVGIAVGTHCQEDHEGQVAEEDYPAEEGGPREDEMNDEEDGEQQTRLPGVEPVVACKFPGAYHRRLGMEADSPHVIAAPLQYQQQDGAQRWEDQVGGGSLVVEPQTQARVELAHASTEAVATEADARGVAGRGARAVDLGIAGGASASTGTGAGARGIVATRQVADPLTLGLGVLQRRGRSHIARAAGKVVGAARRVGGRAEGRSRRREGPRVLGR